MSKIGSVLALARYALPRSAYQRAGCACAELVAITFTPGCSAWSTSQHCASSASYAAAAPFCGRQNCDEFGSVQIATSWIHGDRASTFATKPQYEARPAASSGGDEAGPVTARTGGSGAQKISERYAIVRCMPIPS